MKNLTLLLGASLFTINIFAQAPTNNGPAVPALNGTNARDFWSRAGNTGVGASNSNNIFGTLWNSPIYTQTNAKTCMLINGDRTVGINAYLGQVTDGFVGIGPNTAAQGFPWNAGNAGPFSLLHLNNGVGTFV